MTTIAMSDRANVKITEGKNKVFLYTHWCGSELPAIVKEALAQDFARNRWHDGAYLTRIVFEHMITHAHDKETGFGISSIVGDGEDRIVHVDVDKQTVKTWARPAVAFETYIKD